MKRVLIGLVLIFSVTASFGQKNKKAKVFEGHIKYKYEMLGEGAESMAAFLPESMEIYTSKEGLVTKMNGGMMATMMGKILVNDKGAYILQEAEQKALEMDQEELAKDAADKVDEPVVEKLDETEKILGYKCQKYKTVTKDESTGEEMTNYVWVTDQFVMPEFKSSNTNNVSVKGIDGVALKTMTSVMGFTVTLTALEVSETKPDKTMFTVPSSYTVEKFDPNTFGGGLGN